MLRKAQVARSRPQEQDKVFNPNSLIELAGKDPSFSFYWGDPSARPEQPKKVRKKRRFIGHPNKSMRRLHELFEEKLSEVISKIDGRDGYLLRKTPSATGCVKKSNHVLNAEAHKQGEYFYITDFAHAYPSVDLERLTLLLVYIFKYAEYGIDYPIEYLGRNELARFALKTDPFYDSMHSFVQFAFGGLRGRGLAVGGNLSPQLLNLYCEVFINSHLRAFCEKYKDEKEPQRSITFTQYVDDYVFSRGIPISSDVRREIRGIMHGAGFEVNHRKSKVLMRSMGTVFVTKVGLRPLIQLGEPSKPGASVLVFPQKKRRRLHGIIQSYLKRGADDQPLLLNDSPEVIRGLIAEFIYYYKKVEVPTETDKKTFALCKEFQKASSKYRKRYKQRRKTR